MDYVPGIAARANRPPGPDMSLAVGLTMMGVLEAAFGPAEGSRLVSALALPLATLPLTWRRTAPVLPLVAIAVAFMVQAPLDGFLVGQSVMPLVALLIALYSAGRYIDDERGFAAAMIAAAVVVTTRIVVDPEVARAGDALLTLAAVVLPLLVGRWVRGQALLQRALEETSSRLRRQRRRDARHAAEEERVRIASDLQEAVEGELRRIITQAERLPGHLRAGDHATARAVLAGIAATARDALGDVRRILGILRRDGQAAPREPALPDRQPAHEPLSDPVVSPQDRDAAGLRSRVEAGSVRARLAGDARALDRLLVVVLLAGAGIEVATMARPVAIPIALAIVIPLLWRRHRPLTVAAFVLGAVSVQSLVLDLDAFPLFDVAAVTCTTYAIGAYAERSTAIAGVLVFALADAVHAAIFYPAGVVAALLGGVAVPWTIGRIVRNHRELTDEGREEAARVQRRRAREARAAVTAERMRVARELHDAVAHSISVIAIQAGGAEPLVARDPERAARHAGLIESVARDALGELGRLVGGAPDAGNAGQSAEQPRLAGLGTLVGRARDAGLPVELRVDGEPAALPTGVDLAAYRIVQEALANASKHAGPARALVVVRYERDAVELEVSDDGHGPTRELPGVNGQGHGLVGIRERVAIYGGTLNVGGRPAGGFRVHARLPFAAS